VSALELNDANFSEITPPKQELPETGTSRNRAPQKQDLKNRIPKPGSQNQDLKTRIPKPGSQNQDPKNRTSPKTRSLKKATLFSTSFWLRSKRNNYSQEHYL
jgi:hypothetical protein